MKVDIEGNVYCGGSGGIWVMDPHGKHLGTIVHRGELPANFRFEPLDGAHLAQLTGPSLASLLTIKVATPFGLSRWK